MERKATCISHWLSVRPLGFAVICSNVNSYNKT